MGKAEYRSVAGAPNVVEDGRFIEGYAVHWNVRSTKPKITVRNGKPFAFWEKIAPHAFKKSLDAGEDVICCRDHKPSMILGRLRSKTLEINLDDKGTFYRCALPAVSYADDLKVSITREDVFGNSFGMIVSEDTWTKAEDGLPERTIVEAILFDVSPVTDPTYEDAEVVLNSLDRFLESKPVKTPEDPWIVLTRLRLEVLKTPSSRRQRSGG